MKRIALIANSKITHYSLIKPKILQHEQVIAVDGGLNHCHRMQITPNLIIGDLDSAEKGLIEQYSTVPTKTFPKDKDHSDLELGIIHCLEMKSVRITLFGALENRMDHSLSNLYLLTRYPSIDTIESDHETIFCITGSHEFHCQPDQCISLIPLGEPCSGVSTSGLKWELNNQTLDKEFFSLSNVCLKSTFSIDVKKGTLLCCIYRS
jgi:thiamine pyrophosphokinase